MARILLADDDAAMRDLVGRALIAEGHSVSTAADGQDALDLAISSSARFDLLVTDVQMPGLDGISLAERLLGLNPGVRIILMSGFQGDLGRAEALKAGGARFVAKPFTLEQMRAEVRRAIA